MGADMQERVKAATALAKYLGTATGRKSFAENGFKPDNEIVVALPDDAITDVMKRVIAYDPPVVIAVWFAGEGRFGLLSLEPGLQAGAPVPEEIAGGSTVGLLCDWMEIQARRGRSQITFRLTDWAVARGFSPNVLVSA